MSNFYNEISEDQFNDKVTNSVNVSQECIDLFNQINIPYKICSVDHVSFIGLPLYGKKYIDFGKGVCIELPDEWFLVVEGIYGRQAIGYYLCDQLEGLKKFLTSDRIDESVSNKKNLYELLVDEEKFLSSHKLEKINNKEFKKVELFLSGYKVELELTVICYGSQRYSGFISNSLYKYYDNKYSDQSE